MNNYIIQADLRAKGWSTLRIFRLGRPDAALLDAAPHPPGQYVGLRAEHGVHIQRAWHQERVQAAEINWRC